MSNADTELHALAERAFLAILADTAVCHLDAAKLGYEAALSFLAERERRGWRCANAAEGKVDQ